MSKTGLRKHLIVIARSQARLSDGRTIAARNENAIKLQNAIAAMAYGVLAMRPHPQCVDDAEREDRHDRADGSVARVIAKGVANMHENAAHLLADTRQVDRELPAGHERLYVLVNVRLSNADVDRIVESEDAIPAKVYVEFCGWIRAETLRTGEIVSYRNNRLYKQRIGTQNRTLESFMEVLYGRDKWRESENVAPPTRAELMFGTIGLCAIMLDKQRRKRLRDNIATDPADSTENKKQRTTQNE